MISRTEFENCHRQSLVNGCKYQALALIRNAPGNAGNTM